MKVDGKIAAEKNQDSYKRFLARCQPTEEGCMLWQGAVNDRGYPMINGTSGRRVLWQLMHGPLDSSELVTVRCSSVNCLSENHLVLTNLSEVGKATQSRLKKDEKKCRKCETIFSTKKCNECARRRTREWIEKNKGRKKISDAQYYINNKERRQQYMKRYRVDRRHVIDAYYQERANEMRQRARKYRQMYPEQCKAARDRWAKSNPHKLRVYKANRRSRLIGVLSPNIVGKLFNLQRGMCACCRRPLGKNFHLDHIIPLALGGTNVDANVQLLRQRCNNEKHAKHPIDFMQSRGFLL